MNKFGYGSSNDLDDSSIVPEKTNTPISFSDIVRISAVIIPCLIVLTLLAVNESDSYSFIEFSIDQIFLNEIPSYDVPKTATVIIDGKHHNITVKLIVEQKTESVKIY